MKTLSTLSRFRSYLQPGIVCVNFILECNKDYTDCSASSEASIQPNSHYYSLGVRPILLISPAEIRQYPPLTTNPLLMSYSSIAAFPEQVEYSFPSFLLINVPSGCAITVQPSHHIQG